MSLSKELIIEFKLQVLDRMDKLNSQKIQILVIL